MLVITIHICKVDTIIIVKLVGVEGGWARYGYKTIFLIYYTVIFRVLIKHKSSLWFATTYAKWLG